ncbi:DNA gyrase subunit A [Candidatus Nardonella dryophthoridicola]|uniref:DNA topoisomerase (ATP-hydrolyzing) n=1 Tax=endosymbiont of Rhynchophorus ferrugineus TaxID=1972133 RepID=A0A2Z5T915_9GAMM|nr:DNA gyrase subunit A [Candidatus Nardonella dryophthoridicola]BBA85066.1 DNA gyrase subunit A [endosymbiont of Rhynchophorus ferrugineus]
MNIKDTTNNKNFIENELKDLYIKYSISVITNRAIPDSKDGLKPVHRRILYSMYKLNNYYNKPFKKSARIVGDVIGKYHPHGDIAVYNSIIKMVQKFTSRYPLIDGQGNFGSIDGDPAAAMRYTEIKMSKICHELFNDLNDNIIEFEKNYDGTENIPKILPSKIPNLLINGTYGIAVGIITNIPPHNINEVIDGCIELIKNPNISIEDLNKIIIAPDFPTSGIIINKNDNILNIYKNGYGKFVIKSKVKITNNSIIVYEIPYQVNKLKLIESIVKLIKNKYINGISNIYDESDKNGLRIIIEIKKNYIPYNILNELFEKTKLKINYSINMIALYNNKPKRFNLKELIESFINYRKYIIKKKIYNIFKNNLKRMNIIEGIIIAIYNINDLINIIINSKKYKDLIKNINNLNIKIINNYKNINNELLINNIKNKNNNNSFRFNKEQIKSILNLKISKLMNIEYNKIIQEYEYINNINNKYKLILNDKNELNNYIIEELLKIKKEYFDNRITKVIYNDENNIKNINNKNNNKIMNKNFFIILTDNGYIKYKHIDEYKIQNRKCKGKLITKIFNNDKINKICLTDISSILLIFTNLGKIYSYKTENIIKLCNENKNINNIISILKNENINYILSIHNNEFDKSIIICTKLGFIKKIKLTLFKKIRSNGILIMKLNNNDEIVNVNVFNDDDNDKDIIIFTKNGKSLRFNKNIIKYTTRNSYGIKSIRLSNFDIVISILLIKTNDYIFNITEKGFGKITHEKEYIKKSRLTKGIKSIKLSDKIGKLKNTLSLNNNDNILIFTNLGYLLKINSNSINKTKRNTKGVLIIKLNKEENIIYIHK